MNLLWWWEYKMNVYRDKFYKIEKYVIPRNGDIFETILEQRKDEIDKDRFFLRFIPREKLNGYDLTNPNDAQKFTDMCYSIDSPLMLMGGYNMDPKYLNDDIRDAGIKMSDPYGRIYGSFDVRDNIITYSPFFANFHQERDLCKFANDEYFTTMTFEEIMLNQISKAKELRLHIGNYTSAKDILKNGQYILETVSKNQMISFVQNPEEGAKVYQKAWKL